MTDSMSRLTLHLTTRRLQDATSEKAPYWTVQCPRGLNVIIYYIETVKRNKFYYAFPLMRRFKEFNT